MWWNFYKIYDNLWWKKWKSHHINFIVHLYWHVVYIEKSSKGYTFLSLKINFFSFDFWWAYQYQNNNCEFFRNFMLLQVNIASAKWQTQKVIVVVLETCSHVHTKSMEQFLFQHTWKYTKLAILLISRCVFK